MASQHLCLLRGSLPLPKDACWLDRKLWQVTQNGNSCSQPAGHNSAQQVRPPWCCLARCLKDDCNSYECNSSWWHCLASAASCTPSQQPAHLSMRGMPCGFTLTPLRVRCTASWQCLLAFCAALIVVEAAVEQMASCMVQAANAAALHGGAEHLSCTQSCQCLEPSGPTCHLSWGMPCLLMADAILARTMTNKA